MEMGKRGKWLVGPTTGSRLPYVEGLRALAAGAIVLYHVWLYGDPHGTQPLHGFKPFFESLPLGVTLFFTLSGFLLYRPFARALLRGEQRPALKPYLRNRALRILPAYWFVLLITGLVLGSALVHLDIQAGSLVHHPGLLARDALLVQDYARSSMVTGIGPAWSLAIEAVFYLALPLLVFGAFAVASRGAGTRNRRRAALLPALTVFAIGVTGKIVAAVLVPGLGQGQGWINDWHSVLERSFLAQADLFTFGMVLAVVAVEVDDGRLRLPRRWRTFGWLALGAVAVPTAVAFKERWLGSYPYDTLMAFSCGLLVALVALPHGRARSPRLNRALESRGLVTLGVMSYSLFLWHEPLIWFLRDHGLTRPGTFGFIVNVVFVGAVSVCFAALTYRFVELPALRRKSKATPIPGAPRRAPRPGSEAARPSVRA